MRMMRTVLAFLLSGFEIVLTEDQAIDWRLHIQFMPSADPVVTAVPVGSMGSRKTGKLRGPVRNLLNLNGKRTLKD